MTTHKDAELKLQNKELKKEITRLQTQNAKLKVQVFSLKREVAQMRKFSTPRSSASDKNIKEMIEQMYGDATKKLPAA
jgi:predicted  nucleic acid-binding Zn-ribbon protein